MVGRRGGERKLRPAGFPPLSTIAIHDKVKFVSKLAVLTEREGREGGGGRGQRKREEKKSDCVFVSDT